MNDGKKVDSGTIRVNHPFIYKGLKFCQATYGIAGVSDFKVVTKNNGTGDETVLKLNMMKKVSLPGSNASFAIARFVTDHGGMGPAVLGVLLEPGKAHDIFWIFQNGRNLNQQQKVILPLHCRISADFIIRVFRSAKIRGYLLYGSDSVSL